MGRFSSDDRGETLVITCPSPFQAPDHNQFSLEMRKWVCANHKTFIFDAVQAPSTPHWFTSGLAKFQVDLKKKGAKLYLVNLSPDAERQVKGAGLTELLSVSPTLEAALARASGAPPPASAPAPSTPAIVSTEEFGEFGVSPSEDWEILLLRACHRAFDGPLQGAGTMTQPEAETSSTAFESAITASLGFQLGRKRGSLWLAFTQPALLVVYQKYTGDTDAAFGPEVARSAGEFAELILQQIQVCCQHERIPAPEKMGRIQLRTGSIPAYPGGCDGTYLDITFPDGAFRVTLRISG